MKNIAIILAGGSGRRLGETLPKQFLKIAGKKVIEHTIQVFQNHPLIDEIAIVVHPDYVRDIEDISQKNSFDKLKKILNGGKERYHSSLAAINAYNEEINMIFHDAVRPLVNDRIITDCIEALLKYNAVDVAIPATDTIIQINEQDEIVSIPSRHCLRNGQTPQAFRRSVIKAAYDKALQDPNFSVTDDCGVVLKYLPQEPVYVVNGELSNMKLTYKEDIFLLDKLFQLRSEKVTANMQHRCSSGEMSEKVAIIFGGSYGIGYEIFQLLKEHGIQSFSFSRSLGVDVSAKEDVQRAYAEVYSKAGRIDWVINTAGIMERQPLKNMSYASISECIDVNYLGAIIVAREAYHYLKETKGSLLLFTSSSYTRGRASYSIYSSTKAAIVNLVQALGEEWLDENIRINCINPERTRTPMRTRNFGMEPLDTLLDPRVVANASITTLLSDMTGQVIDIKNKINKGI